MSIIWFEEAFIKMFIDGGHQDRLRLQLNTNKPELWARSATRLTCVLTDAHVDACKHKYKGFLPIFHDANQEHTGCGFQSPCHETGCSSRLLASHQSVPWTSEQHAHVSAVDGVRVPQTKAHIVRAFPVQGESFGTGDLDFLLLKVN